MRAAFATTLVALAAVVAVVVLRDLDERSAPVPPAAASPLPPGAATVEAAPRPTGGADGAATALWAVVAASGDAGRGAERDPSWTAGQRSDEDDDRAAAQAGAGGVIDVQGDVDAATRDRYGTLAAAHLGERPVPPWTVRWVLVTAGEPVVDAEDVAATAAEVLADPRGWGLRGAVRWERVEDEAEADVHLVVAAAEEMPTYAEECVPASGVPDASCTVGNHVVINDLRWRDGALGDAIPLGMFRAAELNHELGHWLGQGHFSCLDGAAPVNQQQFRSLAGCQANAWPLPWEQAMVAVRFGLWPSLAQFEPSDGLAIDTAAR